MSIGDIFVDAAKAEAELAAELDAAMSEIAAELDSLKLSVRADVPDMSKMNDLGKKIVEAWQAHAQELVDLEKPRIEGRMPDQTGTLISSLTGVANPAPNVIASVYTDPDIQASGPWERVYAQYQEGPPLGHSTYTQGMVQYVYRAVPEDVPAIRAWAEKIAQQVEEEAAAEAQAGSSEMGGGGDGGE